MCISWTIKCLILFLYDETMQSIRYIFLPYVFDGSKEFPPPPPPPKTKYCDCVGPLLIGLMNSYHQLFIQLQYYSLKFVLYRTTELSLHPWPRIQKRGCNQSQRAKREKIYTWQYTSCRLEIWDLKVNERQNL